MLAFGMLTLGAPDLRSQTKTGAKGNSVSNAAVSSDLSQGPGKDASKIAAIKSFASCRKSTVRRLRFSRLSVGAVDPRHDNPDRLVVDLPNAHFDTQENRISVQADEIAMLRADQLQQSLRSRAWSSICSRRAPLPGTLPETDSSCISGRIPPKRTARRFSRLLS